MAAGAALAAGVGLVAITDRPVEPLPRADPVAIDNRRAADLWNLGEQWPIPAPKREIPPATTPPPSDSALPVGGELIRQGDKSLIFKGDRGERVRITLVRIGDPEPDRDPGFPDAPEIDPSSGDQIITAEVRVENIGLVRLHTDVEEHVWLFDDQGNEYEYDHGRTESRAAGQPELLDPGAILTRMVIFQVDPSATGVRALVA